MKSILFSVILFFCFCLQAVAEQVLIQGVVKNSKDSVLTFYQNGFDAITKELLLKRHEAPIKSDGSFRIELPIRRTTEWILEVDNQSSIIHLSPQRNVTMAIDLKNGEFLVSASGPNSEYVNYDIFIRKEYYSKLSREYYSDLKKLGIKQYLQARKEGVAKIKRLLETYKKSNDFDPEYYKWLITLYRYLPYERTLVELVSNSLREDPEINEVLFSEGFTDDYAAMNIVAYNNLVEQYIHYKYNGGKFPLDITKLMGFLDQTQLLSGKTKQVKFTKLMSNLHKSEDSTYLKSRLLFIKNVDDQSLIKMESNLRKEYIASKHVLEKKEIDQSLSLAKIFGKYKGKVIYLDFWASWCGPCRMEMPNAAKLKNRLKDKDIVFLYLGYKDSKVNWLIAQQEITIDGEHYLLTDEMVKEANKLFNIHGIPHYAIIDKQGLLVEKNAKGPRYVYDDLLEFSNNTK